MFEKSLSLVSLREGRWKARDRPVNKSVIFIASRPF